jgi:hypothetical protein
LASKVKVYDHKLEHERSKIQSYQPKGFTKMVRKSLIVLASFLLTACGASSEPSSESVASSEPSNESFASSEPSNESVASSIPVEGACFNYTEADVDSANPADKEVDCSETHTAEIYRVGIWPGDVDPNELSADEALKLADTICMPWDGANGAFNYYAFYFPTPEQWVAGENWVRCDGMNAESDDPLVVTSWSGSLLFGTS